MSWPLKFEMPILLANPASTSFSMAVHVSWMVALPGVDFVVFVGEAGRVADGGVDVFQGDGEVDNVQVEVVDAPVRELLLADRATRSWSWKVFHSLETRKRSSV